jgi:Holliday junction resolvase RusA-like endonuclease
MNETIFECTWRGNLTGVSVNKYLGNGKTGTRFKCPKYRAFQTSLANLMVCKRSIKWLNFNENVHVNIHFFIDTKRDIDNLVKPVLDSLQKSQVIMNDRQVVKLEIEKKKKCFEDVISIQVFKQEVNS